MIASRLVARVKLQVPNIKETAADDNEILAMLSEACDEVNLRTKVYQGYTDFNIVAEQQIYPLSTNVPLYLGMAKERIQFKNSSDQWKFVNPKTLSWIEKKYPEYLNATSAAIPQWYWVEGDDVGFHQKPSTTKALGARLYHLKKANPMTNTDKYPWTGTTTEITALRPMDDAIVAYFKWKYSPAIGAVTDADLREKEFLMECQRSAKQVKRRPDLTGDYSYGIKI